ncbi:hypothetical protein M422DRAFT_261074 [Sphaerobolus stellatus SS14]|uniref:Uncharacterized protein n=1 Tax=Sphaerobolus stellatus (strain SS14) TaxID=990650 RepID=A0A0C9U173_SPHS4|nr:hypothetical protein M422DRAFT_261074 [Sphaerobolus stellatus SS14]
MFICPPVSDNELAPFLHDAKTLTVPKGEVPLPNLDKLPSPSKFHNPAVLTMNENMIAEVKKMNEALMTKYEEKEEKEEWYCKTAVEAYMAAKRKEQEEMRKQRAEAAARVDEARKADDNVKAAAEAAKVDEESWRDMNSAGEEVNQDATPKSKTKRKKSHPIVESSYEEETEEVKVERRKAKGKRKAVDAEFKQNMGAYDYSEIPGVPVCVKCSSCKVPKNAGYNRQCVMNVHVDVKEGLFSVREKDSCYTCYLRNNRCSFTHKMPVDLVMPEFENDVELQVKLKELCNMQDTFQDKRDRDRVVKKKTVTNTKASTSTPKRSKRKIVAEEDDFKTECQPKRSRMVASSAGSEFPSVEESLDRIREALSQSINLLFGYPGCRIKQHIQRYALMEEEEPTNKEVFVQNEEVSVRDLDIVPRRMVEEEEDRVDEDKESRKVDKDLTMKDGDVEEL